MPKNAVDFILPIKYDYLFNEAPKQVIDYLRQIPRQLAVCYALWIANYSERHDWIEQLDNFQINLMVKHICAQGMASHIQEFPKAKYVLFTPITGLELLRYIFANSTRDYCLRGNEWQGNLIKAITLVNAEQINDGPRFGDVSLQRFIKAVNSYRYELNDMVIAYAAVYRAMCLLEFLEANCTDEEWEQISDTLLQELNVQSIKQYIRQILLWVERLDFKPKTKFQIFRDIARTDEFEPYSISYQTCLRNSALEDYTQFKITPFVKLNDIEYAVISISFVIHLAYNSLKFRLKDIYKRLFNKNAQDFFGKYNDQFVEKFLFNRILKYSFGAISDVCFSENECAQQGNDNKKLPDGYVRQGNKILLLECKGKTLSIKVLSDEQKLKSELKRDIVGQQGTGQLIDYCSKLMQQDYSWDEDKPKEFVVYPLLVLDDTGFSAEGFNQYIIEETKEYVDEHAAVVQPFTALDIDTFILISELIRDGRMDIFREIENYHSHISSSRFEEKEISFAMYLRANFVMQSPKIVHEWLKSINKIS